MDFPLVPSSVECFSTNCVAYCLADDSLVRIDGASLHLFVDDTFHHLSRRGNKDDGNCWHELYLCDLGNNSDLIKEIQICVRRQCKPRS